MRRQTAPISSIGNDGCPSIPGSDCLISLGHGRSAFNHSRATLPSGHLPALAGGSNRPSIGNLFVITGTSELLVPSCILWAWRGTWHSDHLRYPSSARRKVKSAESQQCCLTPRSSRPPPAQRVSPPCGCWNIFTRRAYALRLRGRLSSNVRRHRAHLLQFHRREWQQSSHPLQDQSKPT